MTAKPNDLNDRNLRLIGIPIFSLVVPTINHFDKLRDGNPAFLTYLMLSFWTTLFLWEGHRFILLRLRRLFPAYQQTTRRLIVQTGLALLYSLVVTYVLDEILCRGILHDPKLANSDLLEGFRLSLIPTVVVYLLYEAVYFFTAWKQNVRKTEALARESVQSQLEVLKNQLDPHFLFNSLNTLAALIDDQNIDAQLYLERLADVYRYVLVSRNKNTVPLEEEIAFLDAYVYLNKIRFRDNLQVEKQLDPSAYRQCVMPLSLQMLIENAIKHNIVSKENPLIIRIFQEGNHFLVVENNIQEKMILRNTDPRNVDRTASTRVGLQNIINRYELLTDRHVEVVRAGGLFRVKLPLLTN